jgi:5'-nucleotidase
MRILLTNDDGVTSRGLFAAKRALEAVGAVLVIAPDSNRSGAARSITIDRPLTVGEVALRDGSTAYATDGTPVDCVRFGDLGVVGERPDLIVSGINYGYNLGDDVTYSGTVAAAFEGLLLGIPGIAVSQGAPSAGVDFRRHREYDFGPAAAFLAQLVRMIGERGLPEGTVLNVNVPAQPRGAGVCRLGKRIYRDRLELEADDEGRRRYRIYGDDPSYHDEPGTDFRMIAEGRIAVTPIHLDLTSDRALAEIGSWGLGDVQGDQA